MSIGQAFDQGAENYDAARKQLIPCFDDFYGTALELIPYAPDDAFRVLDLGAGTGLFSALVAERYPAAELTLYDLSGNMLDQARKRFEDSRRKVGYRLVDYARDGIEGSFDLVISALSIHHLDGAEKENLFRRLFDCLNKGGMFINADQALGETPATEAAYKAAWLAQVRANGVSEVALDAALERMKEDRMSTLGDQLAWLGRVGFSEVNCWYQHYSFFVCSGRKY